LRGFIDEVDNTERQWVDPDGRRRTPHDGRPVREALGISRVRSVERSLASRRNLVEPTAASSAIQRGGLADHEDRSGQALSGRARCAPPRRTSQAARKAVFVDFGSRVPVPPIAFLVAA
jgi:hypothetical protein